MIIKEQQCEIDKQKCVITDMKMTADELKDTVQCLGQDIKINKTESLS